MARLLLLGGSYLARSIIANVQKCINLYPEINTKDAPVPITHYQRPGFRPLARYDTPPPPPPDPPEPPPDPPTPPSSGTFIAVGGADGTNGAIIKSTDLGITWIKIDVDPGLENEFTWVSTDNLGNWMAVAQSQAYVSTDNGDTWTETAVPNDHTWDYVCAVGEQSFIVIDASIGDEQVLKTEDCGATWTDVTPSGAIDILNAAWDGETTVIMAHKDGGPDLTTYWLSEDSGNTWTSISDSNGYSVPQFISYANATWIIGLAAPGIVYSTTGQSGSWALKDHTGFYTGGTQLYGNTDNYWFGNAYDESSQIRSLTLSDDPEVASNPDNREMFGLTSGAGVVVGVCSLDSTDPISTGIYRTTDALNMTAIIGPAELDGNNMNSVAFGPL